MFYLYVHTVPNGKMYIGMTTNVERRWLNGKGYTNNKEFTRDIEIFGWENIKHEIIDCFEDESDCHMYEMIFSIILNTENPCYGYNKTNFREDFMRKFNRKKSYGEIDLSEISDRNIFEIYNKPYDAGEYLINQWILNERDRKIAKDKLLNGLTYPELSKKYGISTTQAKRICYKAQERLMLHI